MVLNFYYGTFFSQKIWIKISANGSITKFEFRIKITHLNTRIKRTKIKITDLNTRTKRIKIKIIDLNSRTEQTKRVRKSKQNTEAYNKNIYIWSW